MKRKNGNQAFKFKQYIPLTILHLQVRVCTVQDLSTPSFGEILTGSDKNQ